MMKRLSILLLIGTVALGAQAQAPEVAFEQLTMANGLSYFVVGDILQDRQSVLWFATPSGLNRFDRATEAFTHYRH